MSMFKKGLLVAAFGLGAVMMSGGQAEALSAPGSNPATADIAVSVTVTQACQFVADGTLGFPAYNPATGVNASTTLQLNCTNGAVLNVGINNGLNFAGGTRNMSGTATPLPYSLCQDTTTDGTCSLPWGSTVGTDTFTFTGDGTDKDLVVNGLIAPSLNVLSGSYSDSVTVSVAY